MKKFTRIRQWAEEKIKRSHVNLPSEEFKDFQTETKRRHEDYDDLRHSMNKALHHIKKSKTASDEGHLISPVGDFGESLLSHASMFPRDCVYWNILTSFGLGECRLAEAEGGLAEDTTDHYTTLLHEFSLGYKNYQSLCRKMESRRLDYDAKYKRLQKSKKEDPEAEQGVQAAKLKYEETELDVVTSMITLQETEVKHCDALQTLLNLQLAYHRKAINILVNVGYEWDQWTRNCNSTGISPLTSKCTQFDAYENTNSTYKPMLRRALYDHIQNQDDELSFHVNDIITVLHKVDEAWWLGEIVDKDNKRTRGIFPVSYTEKYVNDKETSIDKDSSKSDSDTHENSKNDESSQTNVDDIIVKPTPLKRIPRHLERINTRRPPTKRSTTDWPQSSPSSSVSSWSPTSVQSVMGSLPSSVSTLAQNDDSGVLTTTQPSTSSSPDSSMFTHRSGSEEPPPTPAKFTMPQRQPPISLPPTRRPSGPDSVNPDTQQEQLSSPCLSACTAYSCRPLPPKPSNDR